MLVKFGLSNSKDSQNWIDRGIPRPQRVASHRIEFQIHSLQFTSISHNPHPHRLTEVTEGVISTPS
jgi:hypothetical protein